MLFGKPRNYPPRELSFYIGFDELIQLTLSTWISNPIGEKDYNIHELAFYDSIFGKIIDTINNSEELNPMMRHFKEHCMYQGDIYRIQAKEPDIHWHGLISSFSNSYDFTKIKELDQDQEYKFIHLNTNNCFAIDINKMCDYFKVDNSETRNQNEILFFLDPQYEKEPPMITTCSQYLKNNKEKILTKYLKQK